MLKSREKGITNKGTDEIMAMLSIKPLPWKVINDAKGLLSKMECIRCQEPVRDDIARDKITEHAARTPWLSSRPDAAVTLRAVLRDDMTKAALEGFKPDKLSWTSETRTVEDRRRGERQESDGRRSRQWGRRTDWEGKQEDDCSNGTWENPPCHKERKGPRRGSITHRRADDTRQELDVRRIEHGVGGSEHARQRRDRDNNVGSRIMYRGHRQRRKGEIRSTYTCTGRNGKLLTQ